jgi:hypothetical protein
MVSILAFLVVWLSVFGILMLWLCIHPINYREEQILLETADSQLETATSQLETDTRTAHIRLATFTVLAAESAQETHLETASMLFITTLSGPFLPISLAVAMFNAFGTFGLTDFMSSLNWTARLPFFIPQSTTGLSELDQMFSVCIGIFALFFSLWHAFKSQRHEKERVRREESEKRGLIRVLHSLRQLNEHLGQTQDEAERRMLLNRREILAANMSRLVERRHPTIYELVRSILAPSSNVGNHDRVSD